MNCIEKFLGKVVQAASFCFSEVKCKLAVFWQYYKCKCDGKPGQLKHFLLIHPSKCVWARQPGTDKNADSPLHYLLYVFCSIKDEIYNGQGWEGKQNEECESESFKTTALDNTSMHP